MPIKGSTPCGAKLRGKKAGKTCTNAAMENGRCRMHGGSTPRGLASANVTRGGVRSKVMPKRLAARYQACLEDAELLSLRGDVAMIEAMILEKFEEIRETDGPDWGEVLEQAEKLTDNFRKWDWTKTQKELTTLAAMIGDRKQSERVMSDIRGLVDQKARLAVAESRRLIDLEQTMTVEEAMILATALGDIVRRHVQDPLILRRIASDFKSVANIGIPGDAKLAPPTIVDIEARRVR